MRPFIFSFFHLVWHAIYVILQIKDLSDMDEVGNEFEGIACIPDKHSWQLGKSMKRSWQNAIEWCKEYNINLNMLGNLL